MTKAKDPTPPLPAPAPLRLRLIAAALIAVGVAIAYSGSLSVPFLFDDQINITDNPYIRLTSLSADQVKRAMVQDGNQLRPLSNLTFGFDYLIHGLNPRVMHLENLALHLVSTLLLFALLCRLAPGAVKTDERKLTIAAAIGAAAWALSPVHTQAASYLVQRHTLMSGALVLGSCYCWVQGRKIHRGRSLWFAGAGLGFAAAAASKENGFLTPFVWLLTEPLLRSAPAARVNRRFVAGLAGAVLAAGGVLTAALALSGMLDGFAQTYRELGYGPLERLATEARVVLDYLVTIVLPLPSRLALDHEVAASTGLFAPWTTAPAVIIILAAFAIAVTAWHQRPALAVCILGFLISLAPESTIVPVELMNDHRMYLAAAFVIPPLAMLAALFLPRRGLPVLIAALVLLGGLTALRNRTWQDPAKLWGDSAKKSPSLYRPWSNLCGALTAGGEFRRALPACDAALARNPPGPMPQINRAISLMRLGERERAGRDFAAAAEQWPDSALARFNYGAFLYASRRNAEALTEISRALQLDQFLVPAYLLRARIHLENGNVAQARADLALLLRLYPENEEARRLLAEANGR